MAATVDELVGLRDELLLLRHVLDVGGQRHDFQVVDLEELFRLGHGRPGHAGQLVIHPEEVLESDRGVGEALALDLDPFLGFDGVSRPSRKHPTIEPGRNRGVFNIWGDLI